MDRLSVSRPLALAALLIPLGVALATLAGCTSQKRSAEAGDRAAESVQPAKVADATRLIGPGEGAISSDGRQMVVSVWRDEDSCILAVDVQTGQTRVLDRLAFRSGPPVLTEDGKWVVFLRIGTELGDVWGVPVGGGGARRVQGPVGSFSVVLRMAPITDTASALKASHLVLCLRSEMDETNKAASADAWVLDPTGAHAPSRLTEDHDIHYEALHSPADHSFVLIARPDPTPGSWWRLSLTEGRARLSKEFQIEDEGLSEARVSPDGTLVALPRWHAIWPRDDGMSADDSLRIRDLTSGDVTEVGKGYGITDVAWCEDGESLACLCERPERAIRLLDVRSGSWRKRLATVSKDWSAVHLVGWSGATRELLYVEGTMIRAVDATGKQRVVLRAEDVDF